MSPQKSLSFVVLSSLVFALLGAAIAALIAILFPEYYEALLEGGSSESFRALPVALGLGTTQGAGTGVAVGIAIVCVFVLREMQQDNQAPNEIWSQQLSRITDFLKAIALTMVFGIAIFVAYNAGGVMHQLHLYSHTNNLRADYVKEILSSGNYPEVDIAFSMRNISLIGHVDTDQDFAELKSMLASQYGTPDAERMLNELKIGP